VAGDGHGLDLATEALAAVGEASADGNVAGPGEAPPALDGGAALLAVEGATHCVALLLNRHAHSAATLGRAERERAAASALAVEHPAVADPAEDGHATLATKQSLPV